MISKNEKIMKSKPRKLLKKSIAVMCVIIICVALFYAYIHKASYTPPPIIVAQAMKFPIDEGAHEQMMEYWTFSGFFRTVSGESFGYRVTYFMSGMRLVAFIDENNITGKRYFSSRNYPDNPRNPSLNINVENDSLNILYNKDSINDVWKAMDLNKYNLNSTIIGYNGNLVHFNVNMNSKKKPIPIGDKNGKTYLNTSGTIYSYFQSDIDLGGKMILGSKEYVVSGRGWIEHSWGDWENYFAEDWNIVLSNGMELFISKIYSKAGSLLMERHYKVEADGKYSLDVYPSSRVQNLKYWLDPSDPFSQRAYSHKWRVLSATNNYNLTVEPKLDDQRIINWVGICSVDGLVDGIRVTGEGYANLVLHYLSTLSITNITNNYNFLSIPNDPVTVTASAFDNLPITALNLHYRLNNGTVYSTEMIYESEHWTAIIPGQSLGTDVDYWITAKDLADKIVESDVYNYTVDI